jgi:hypothetical protein
MILNFLFEQYRKVKCTKTTLIIIPSFYIYKQELFKLRTELRSHIKARSFCQFSS